MVCPSCHSPNVMFGNKKNLCEDCDTIWIDSDNSHQDEKKDLYDGVRYITTTYPVFSGNRNLKEKRIDKNTSFEDVIKKGFELCSKYKTKCFTIEQVKCGTWYIKGYNGDYSLNQIKQILEFNKTMKPPLYPGKCFLIEF